MQICLLFLRLYGIFIVYVVKGMAQCEFKRNTGNPETIQVGVANGFLYLFIIDISIREREVKNEGINKLS